VLLKVGVVIIFGYVGFYNNKKKTKLNLKKKTETGSNRLGLVWFLGQKPIQTGLARFFSGFFVWIRFSFSGFRLIKPNRSVFSKF